MPNDAPPHPADASGCPRVRRPVCAAAVGAAAVVLGFTASARAEGSAFELGASGAYATPPIRGGISPLGAGVGGRAGFVIAPGLYAGAVGTYFFGGSDSGVSERAILFGAELGYGLHLAPWLTLRPQVAVGDALITHVEPPTSGTTSVPSGPRSRRGGGVDVVSGASGSSGTSVHSLYVEPALTAVFHDASHYFSLGAGCVYAPSVAFANSSPTTWLALGVRASAGFVFDLSGGRPAPLPATASR